MLVKFSVAPAKAGVHVKVGRETMWFPNVTEEQLVAGKVAYFSGAYIQDAYPFLTPEQREFLMTGLRPDQRDELYGEEDE